MRQDTDGEADNGTRGDGGQDRVAAIGIADPVMAMRRGIEAIARIVANDDRVRTIAVIAADPVAAMIVAVIIVEGHTRPVMAVIVARRAVIVAVHDTRGRIVPAVMIAAIPVAVAVAIVAPVAAVVA